VIDRVLIAFGCALIAAVILLAWSFILVLFFARVDDGATRFVVSNVFSETGLGIVFGAGLLSLVIGPDRMVQIFSVFLGTHPFWSRAGAWLEEKLEPLKTEYNVSLLTACVAAVVLSVAAWLWFG
jgi:hypothetical protein